MKFFLASNNPHKLGEFQILAAAAGGKVAVAGAREAGGMPAVAEDTGTFAGNARQKARALRARLPPEGWALADDSGLCVDALGGLPGVDSAYYAGPHGDAAANLAKLVQALRDVPAGQRGAHFVCVLAVLGPGGEERLFEGKCGGRLLVAPAGAGGFGYDPLFVPEGQAQSFGQLGEAVKSELSHRARAWAQLVEWADPAKPSTFGASRL